MSLDIALELAHTPTTSLDRAILLTLAYADVFEYPLTLPEVHRYLSAQRATVGEVTGALSEMVHSRAIACNGEFFTLPGRESIVETRRDRSRIAVDIWRKALRYGRLISALPFVRMVAVTGSLAMRNAERGNDIDFLVVSTPSRLWTCRAFILMLARIAALEGVTLCPNYMVTTNALEFQERSLYVAHELAQMIPLSSPDIYDQIRCLNAWTDGYLPNAQGMPQPCLELKDSPRWQRLVEAALAVLPVDRFERWEMKRKIRRLSREQAGNPEAFFSADVCKGHADRHGQQTELLLNARLSALEAI